MKTALLGIAVVAALIGTPAAAADMPVKAPPPPAAVGNWTGFYVGMNAGGSIGFSNANDSWIWFQNYPAGTVTGLLSGGFTTGGPVTTTFNDQYRHVSMGFVGGLQGGYNWQIGHVVLGLEGDWNWSSGRDTVTYTAQPVSALVSLAGAAPPVSNFAGAPGTTQGWTSQERIDWLTTWRARLGWAHDSSMWYGTGGVALAKVEDNYTLFSTPGSPGTVVAPGIVAGGNWGLPGGVAVGNFSTTRIGWVLGGGVETSLARLFGWGNNNWSMKLEYLFVDLGSVNHTIATGLTPQTVVTLPALASATATGSTSFFTQDHVYENIIRVGLNYRFNYAALPVMTK